MTLELRKLKAHCDAAAKNKSDVAMIDCVDILACITEIERLRTALRDLYNDCRNEPCDKQRGIVMDQAFEALEGA